MSRHAPTRPRKKRQWFRETSDFTEILDGTNVNLLGMVAADYNGLGFGNPTIVRIRGRITFHADPTTGTVGLSQRMAFGIITQKGGQNLSTLSPKDDANEAWMFWSAYHAILLADGSTAEDVAASYQTFEFDVKAMRILKGLDELVFNVSNFGDSVLHVDVGVTWSVLLQE